MQILLTSEQWAAVIEAGEQPPLVCDPGQATSFVLLRTEVYERYKGLFEDVPVTEDERRFQLAEFGRRAGWDDPAMDAYDELDPRRKS